MYNIEILSSAHKALKRINREDRIAIAKAIDGLSQNPRPYGYKKLKGSKLYRIRIGDYRVIYQINNAKLVVLIVRIGHRREIYRR